MTQRTTEPRPTFTLVDLLAGFVALGTLGWLLGGVVGLTTGWGWAAGSRAGVWLGLGLFTVLVVRTIWLASSGYPSDPAPK